MRKRRAKTTHPERTGLKFRAHHLEFVKHVNKDLTQAAQGAQAVTLKLPKANDRDTEPRNPRNEAERKKEQKERTRRTLVERAREIRE